MPDSHSRVDGTRVLADLNALRGIGDYKTGVHKSIFSEGKPVTCPVRKPTKFNLILNMKPAKLLWLKIAPNFPLLADRVIKQRQAGVYCE